MRLSLSHGQVHVIGLLGVNLKRESNAILCNESTKQCIYELYFGVGGHQSSL